MTLYQESGFRFDFTAASHSAIHDRGGPDEDNLNTATPRDGNTFWPGIDFRVTEDSREVWVEVKSWSYKLILQKDERLKARKDYTRKMGADEFRADILQKFLGTTSYLAWSGMTVPTRVFYVVFLEPPDRSSAALLLPFQDKLRHEFKNAQARPWGGKIKYEVVDLARFRALFPTYPVTRV